MQKEISANKILKKWFRKILKQKKGNKILKYKNYEIVNIKYCIKPK